MNCDKWIISSEVRRKKINLNKSPVRTFKFLNMSQRAVPGRSGDRVPVGVRDFSPKCPGAHPASYSVGTRVISCGGGG